MEKQIWNIGNCQSTVVSDTKIKNTNFPVPPNKEESTDDEIKYYGGYLVCESIGNLEAAKLIAAAPEMLEVLQTIENDTNQVPDWLWKQIKDVIKKATEYVPKTLS